MRGQPMSVWSEITGCAPASTSITLINSSHASVARCCVCMPFLNTQRAITCLNGYLRTWTLSIGHNSLEQEKPDKQDRAPYLARSVATLQEGTYLWCVRRCRGCRKERCGRCWSVWQTESVPRTPLTHPWWECRWHWVAGHSYSQT